MPSPPSLSCYDVTELRFDDETHFDSFRTVHMKVLDAAGVTQKIALFTGKDGLTISGLTHLGGETKVSLRKNVPIVVTQTRGEADVA